MEYINETAKKKITRADLKVGDEILTFGYHDDIDINFKKAKIIKMEEYGNLLVEFDESFDKRLHSGYKDVGKAKHCLYIPLTAIRSIDKTEFDEIIKKEQVYDSDSEWWFSNRGKKVD